MKQFSISSNDWTKNWKTAFLKKKGFWARLISEMGPFVDLGFKTNFKTGEKRYCITLKEKGMPAQFIFFDQKEIDELHEVIEGEREFVGRQELMILQKSIVKVINIGSDYWIQKNFKEAVEIASSMGKLPPTVDVTVNNGPYR